MKKFFYLFIILMFAFSLMQTTSSVSTAYTPPLMYRVNANRTAHQDVEGPKSNGLKWEHRISGKVVSSGVFSENGVVYFATTEGLLYGFEPNKGVSAFSVSIGRSIYSTPAIYGDYIFVVGGNPSYIYKYNLLTASKLYRIPVNGDFHSSPLIADGLLIVGNDNGYLYAKDVGSNTASFEWKFNSGALIWSSPAYSDGFVYFGNDNGDFYKVSIKGKEVWKKSLSGKICTAPLVHNGSIYVSTASGSIYQISTNGEILDRFEVRGTSLTSPALLSNGNLAVGSSNHYLYILSKDLKVIYKFNADSPIESSPIVASDDTIYFGTNNGDLFAIDKNGKEIFDFTARSAIHSSPVIGADGTLYFGDDLGWVYALGSKTGVITVTTNLNQASFLIKGPRHYYGEGTNYIVHNAPEGEYTITFQDVPGYKTPKSETKVLKGNSSIHFEGIYEKLPQVSTGSIVVVTNLDNAKFKIEGPKNYDGSGKSFVIKNVPVGIYTVTFEPVEGYITPQPIKKELKADDIITFTGLYKEKPEPKKVVIVLRIGDPYMTVNESVVEVDPGRGTKPVIIPKWSRTVVPIRAIVESLGGKISWDPKDRKVTIQLNDNEVELWIGKNSAKVNGQFTLIDNKNPAVTPVIINDRTMVPVRFVAESLGCTVEWDPKTRSITIIYVEPMG